MERQTIVRKAGRRVQRSGESVAHGAAWFSIALGVVELVAPHAVARVAGLRPGSSHVVRLCGIREIATGIGLLRARNAAPWLWGRVAGDLLDAGIVAKLADKHSVAPVAKAVSAVAAVGAITSIDAFTAHHYKQPARGVAPWEDYSDRSGFPGGVDAARGAASDAPVPADTRTPPALRPWEADKSPALADAARLGDAPPRPGNTPPKSPADRPEGGSPPPAKPGDGVAAAATSKA